jgi:hypothetical protein
MAINLEEIGLTKEEVQERVIDRICERLMRWEREGEERDYVTDSDFHRKLDTKVKEGIDAAINKMAEKHVIPVLGERIEALALQETSSWGEPKGKPKSFIEYLLNRVDFFMNEEVDKEGRARRERDYGWEKDTARINWVIKRQVKLALDQAMAQQLAKVNAALAVGIQSVVQAELQKITDKLGVEVAA